MSQAAPPSDKAAKPAANKPVPPDERFWQRYSPHAELPLSSAGSFVVHILAFGLLLLMSYLATLFFNSNRSLPVEAVQLSGGGGDPKGIGEGPNTGAQPVEAASQSNEKQATDTQPNEAVPPPDLKINPTTPPKPKFNEPGRQVQMEDSSKTFQNLRLRAGKVQSPGSDSPSGSGYGKGGTGRGGGSGSGIGPGIGRGTGAGTENLTQSEKRHARWDMLLSDDSASPSGYVKVLQSLGAIIAVPVRDNGEGFQYMIVRDLSARPAKLLNENFLDVLQETGTTYYWMENKPTSAKDVFSVLRMPVPKIPPERLHFIAILPAKFEQKLFRLEIEYLNKKHPGHSEDDIERTKFRLKGSNERYEPAVVDQKLAK